MPAVPDSCQPSTYNFAPYTAPLRRARGIHRRHKIVYLNLAACACGADGCRPTWRATHQSAMIRAKTGAPAGQARPLIAARGAARDVSRRRSALSRAVAADAAADTSGTSSNTVRAVSSPHARALRPLRTADQHELAQMLYVDVAAASHSVLVLWPFAATRYTVLTPVSVDSALKSPPYMRLCTF